MLGRYFVRYSGDYSGDIVRKVRFRIRISSINGWRKKQNDDFNDQFKC